jgi:hypothetical protein
MISRHGVGLLVLFLTSFLTAVLPSAMQVRAQTNTGGAAWSGVVRDSSGKTVSGAEVELRADGSERYKGIAGWMGCFRLAGLQRGAMRFR